MRPFRYDLNQIPNDYTMEVRNRFKGLDLVSITYGKQMEKQWKEWLADFILGGSKRIADGDCSLKIKRALLLGKKFVANLDSILKSRDITWPTNVHLVKAMVFPGVICGCESGL